VLEFLCPQGHKIRCSDAQAGRAAKCPRCGVQFLIPIPTEHEAPQVGHDSAASVPELAQSKGAGSSPSSPLRTRPKEPQIEFLCPNGHHLHGPSSLQGRAGECPECGSRFRIPTYDDNQEQTAPEEEISLAGLDGDSAPIGSDTWRGEQPVEIAPLPSPAPIDLDGEPSPPPMLIEPEPIQLEPEVLPEVAAVPIGHPLGELFTRLWAIKGQGKVEVRLTGGEVLVAEVFAQNLSQRSHGVFGAKDAENGAYTLTVVPWDSVERVLLTGVKELPGDISDR
jgi:hypothetical protein